MKGLIIIEILLSLALIYVVYSLLTTICVELIASIFRLRARMLRKAIRRMLQDDKPLGVKQKEMSVGKKLFRRLKGQQNDRQFVTTFFEHPSIKYLGKNELMSTPSYIGRDVFSKTIISILTAEHGATDLASIENSIGYYEQFDKKILIGREKWNEFIAEVDAEKDPKVKKELIDEWFLKYDSNYLEDEIEFTDLEVKQLIHQLDNIPEASKQLAQIKSWQSNLESGLHIEDETRLQLCSLYKQSGGNINAFNQLIGDWFDNTMDRAIGWYKKKISRITFFFGFIVAVWLNVDTVYTVQTLQQNTAAREAMMVAVENAPTDSLEAMQESLRTTQVEINKAIALGGDRDNAAGSKFWMALLGWLLTAIAISLGAPFWFDMLNKLIKLKSSLPPPPSSGSSGNDNSDNKASRLAAIRKQAKG